MTRTVDVGREISLEHRESDPVMNFINLATMDSLAEAEKLSQRLADQGIPTRLYDERDMQRYLFLSKPVGHGIVQVRESDFPRGASLVKEWEAGEADLASHLFSCPECGSLAVEYPQFTRKAFITPLLIEWASHLKLFKKQFYCRKCHATWPPDQKRMTPNQAAQPATVLAPPSD